MATPRLGAASTLAALSRCRQISSLHTGASSLRHPSSRPSKSDPVSMLSRPTWSVRSLLPGTNPDPQETTISVPQLHHLLRLSALPLPRGAEEEVRMIATLQSQLHFVRDIQRVDVSGVEPLRSIRDETSEGMAEATIGVEELREALSEEIAFGRAKRPRRQKKALDMAGVEDWNALQTASRKAGRYFVVRSAKVEG